MFETKEEILESIIDKYGRAMVNFAYTYVKDWSAAEDAAQDALIKIYRREDTFNHQSSLKTWIFSIVANQCKDHLRKNYVKKLILGGFRDRDLIAKDASPDQQVDAQEAEKELAEKILALPVKYREVIILHYYEDLSVGEISDFLGTNLSTVKSRLQRARNKLRSSLGEGMDYA